MKRSSSFYIGLFLIGILPLVALKCKSDLEKAAEALNGTWTVSDATGLPSFTFSGTTTITFTVGEEVTTGTFSVTGAENLPRIVENNEQVTFPASGTFVASGTDNVNSITLTTDGGVELTLNTSNFGGEGATELVFTYSGAEPKVADESTVTVTAAK